MYFLFVLVQFIIIIYHIFIVKLDYVGFLKKDKHLNLWSGIHPTVEFHLSRDKRKKIIIIVDQKVSMIYSKT